LEASSQGIITRGNFEKGRDQKPDPDVQRDKHKDKDQVCPRTPHEKQKDHEPPENEIESDGNVVSGSPSAFGSIAGRGVGSCNTPYRVNKDPETEEESGKGSAGD
jgi:hypothetical protein